MGTIWLPPDDPGRLYGLTGGLSSRTGRNTRKPLRFNVTIGLKFVGILVRSLPKRRQRTEENLIARHTLNGLHIGAAWRKNS
jgi:hypothetical protein